MKRFKIPKPPKIKILRNGKFYTKKKGTAADESGEKSRCEVDNFGLHENIQNYEVLFEADAYGLHEITQNDDTVLQVNNDVQHVVPAFDLHQGLPPISAKTVELSRPFDDHQVFLIFDDGQFVMTAVVKTEFVNGPFFVSGCSGCHNDSYRFSMLIDQGAQSLNYEGEPSLLNCKHIKICISHILMNLNSWQPVMSEELIQNNLKDFCSFPIENRTFEYENYSGIIMPSKGIFLFVMINGVWRCCCCKNRPATLCTHGGYLKLSNEEIVRCPVSFELSPIVSQIPYDREFT